MIERFVEAQNEVYIRALDEIKSGRKRSHWMWFIFPQIKGLGLSVTSVFFSITDVEEAKEYLSHPLLGLRLREISHALLELKTDNPTEVFGYTDAMKLRSCMTLFDVIEPESVFDKVLLKFFDGKRDEKTLTILADHSIEDKMLGCLYGQAIGDALGLGTEFMNKDEVYETYPDGLCQYEQIVQDAHRKRWPIGAWTDDTDMMLCILSAFENGKFKIHQVARNFKEWFNGDPLGIGGHTFKVLCMSEYVEKPEMCSELWWNLSRHQSAANGALMRTSVVGLAHDNIETQAIDICKLTHYDPRCIGSCVIASLIIHNLVWNDYELTYDEIKEIATKFDERIIEWIDLAYQNEDISALDLDEKYTIGYTLRTLAAALWCYWHVSSFEEGLLAIVNEGGDADTNGAIACAILGAKFGYSSIPAYYIENLNNRTAYHQKITSFINKIKAENA